MSKERERSFWYELQVAKRNIRKLQRQAAQSATQTAYWRAEYQRLEDKLAKIRRISSAST